VDPRGDGPGETAGLLCPAAGGVRYGRSVEAWRIAATRSGHPGLKAGHTPLTAQAAALGLLAGSPKRVLFRTTDRYVDGVGSVCGTCDAPLSTPWDTHDPPPSGPFPQWGVLVVDVDATLWHSGLSWWAAWTAGGMVERPPPPDEQPQRARVWDIFLSLLS
jgi:hypothetical protein